MQCVIWQLCTHRLLVGIDNSKLRIAWDGNFVTPRKTDELYGGEILSQAMISCSFNELFSVKGVFSIKQVLFIPFSLDEMIRNFECEHRYLADIIVYHLRQNWLTLEEYFFYWRSFLFLSIHTTKLVINSEWTCLFFV